MVVASRFLLFPGEVIFERNLSVLFSKWSFSIYKRPIFVKIKGALVVFSV